MAANNGESERLIKELVQQLMTAAGAAGKDAADAARTAALNARPALLGPELLMAARGGDGNRLKQLLNLPADQDDGHPLNPAAVAASGDGEELGQGCAKAMIKPLFQSKRNQSKVGHHPPAGGAAPHVAVDVRDDDAASSPRLRLLDGVTRNEGDSLLHVAAAAGDGDGFLRCARTIYHGKTSLLFARNDNGDTPLHCAAGAGNAEMISCLLGLAAAAGEETAAAPVELVRIRNNSGETALHQAVRAASKASIYRLMKQDPELACVPDKGDKGITTSPLYLAISLALDTLLEKFKDVLAKGESRSLLASLTTQRDECGSTPLHLAASLEGRPLAGRLSNWFPRVWPKSKSTIERLLDINPCPAYQSDNEEGLYPIHVAASVGSLKSVKALLDKCPDCATLCDGRGRTFLHVAVEKERHEVVKQVCRMKDFSSVLNMQDKNGDTALHRAVHVGNLDFFNCLIRNRLVRLDIPNKDELTPLDLSWSKIPPTFYYKWNPRHAIHSSLQYVGGPCGGSRTDILYQKYIPERNEKEVSKDLTDSTQVMGIISVLVATMAFAGAFTFPGGYYQSANDGVPGAAVLGGSYVFDAFVIANGLTFICSCLATFGLIFSGLPAMDLSLRYKYFYRSADFLYSSVRSLAIAFAMGLYLLLAPVSHTLSILEFVVCFLSLLFGQIPALMVIRVAYTACIRSAVSKKTARVHLVRLFKSALLPSWSFVLIFGVPFIIRRLRCIIHIKLLQGPNNV
ncbi:hypothetical protein ACP4OV_017083 [Aristida adscensionis]